MNRTGSFFRNTAAIMSAVMAFTPVIIRADSIGDVGREGQAFGKTMLPSQASLGTYSNGTLTMPNAGDLSVQLDELFPSAGTSIEGTTEDYFPNAQSVSELQDVSQSDDAMLSMGASANQALGNDANSSNPSMQGQIYDLMRDQSDRTRPDFQNDPVLGMTSDLFNNMDTFGEAFPACDDSSSASYDPASANYKSCDRIDPASLSGTVSHQYTAGVLEHYSGPVNLNPCEGALSCFKLWIGKVGNNYWDNHDGCSIFEQSTSVRVTNPEAITKATLEYAKWDDRIQVYAGPPGDDVKIWQSDTIFPPETPGKCDPGNSNANGLNVDVTDLFKDIQPGSIVTFRIRVSVGDRGEGYGRINIDYDPKKVIKGDVWAPQNQIDDALVAHKNFDNAVLSCIDEPPSENGCITNDALRICEDDFQPSPLPGISPLCKEVEWHADIDTYRNQQNPWCETYEKQESCGFVSSECADYAEDGSCIRHVDRYNCNSSSSLPSCDLANTLPEAFQGCEQVTQETPFTETARIHDFHVCEQTHSPEPCEVQRQVQVRSQAQEWDFSRSCVDDEILRYTPDNAKIMMSGVATLSQTGSSDVSASIIEQPSASNGWTTRIQLSGNCKSAPGAIAGKVKFTGKAVQQTVTHDSEDSNVARCMMQSDGFTSVEWQCLEGGSRTVSGERIGSDELQLLEELYPTTMGDPDHLVTPSTSDGKGSTCWRARATYQADFNIGEGSTWTDPQGESHTIENAGGNNNSCVDLENDPQCEYVRSECTEGAEGGDGACYVTNLIYDCGKDVEIKNMRLDTTYSCPGETRCMGSDCLDLSKGQSQDFAKAAALLNSAQFMGGDMSCSGTDEEGNIIGDENVVCEVFAGESGECKKAVGGTVDCCEKPKNISMQDYLTMIMAVPKLDSAIMSIEDPGMFQGAQSAYSAIRTPVVEGFKSVTQPFTSYFDGVSGAYDTATNALQEKAVDVVNQFKSKISEMASKAFGTAVEQGGVGAGGAVPGGADMADGATNQAGESFTQQVLGQQGAAIYGNVMAVYTAYVVAMMVIQYIYECEEDEFELNAKRQLKACNYVGSYCASEIFGVCIEKRESYCCFNSPLSRIIQEQGRAQLGEKFGNAKNPQCGGLSLDQIGELDWNAMDLSEWTAMLQENALYPDPVTMDVEGLTGSGSLLETKKEGSDSSRANAVDRTMLRFEGIDTHKAANEAYYRMDSSISR